MKKFFNIFLVLSAVAFMCACSGNDENIIVNNKIAYSSDMEYEKWMGGDKLVKDIAHSGKYSSRLDSNNAYSFGFTQLLSEIGDTIPKVVSVNFWLHYPEIGISSQLVISIDSAGKNIFWLGHPLKDSISQPNQWKEIKTSFTLPENLQPDNKINIYVWSNDKRTFYMDDLTISFP